MESRMLKCNCECNLKVKIERKQEGSFVGKRRKEILGIMSV